jgi:hypothetical protein
VSIWPITWPFVTVEPISTSSASRMPVMLDDTLILRSGSSLPAPLTVRVIEVRAAGDVCTSTGGASFGRRLETATIPTRATTTRAKIHRAIVIAYLP